MLSIKKKLQKLFKKISYKVFKIIYGNVSKKITHKDNKDITFDEIEIEKSFYKIFYCIKSSLYTDTIHDTALIKENKIIEGPSFQLRNNYNTDCLNNSVIKNGTPRLRKKVKGTVLSLLTGGGGNTNYWHWLFDVLPRIEIYKKKNKNFDKIDFFLFPSLNNKFQKESLDLLKINPKKRLSSKNYRHFKADRIIATSHPYNILNDPSADSLNIPSWIYDHLRVKFLEKGLQNSKLKSFPEKIYINRKDATSLRYIINLKEVEDILEKENYYNLTLSNFSFTDQIALFYNAKKIIGLHGAGFANLIYCNPETKVIELKSNTAGDAIKNLAIKNKLIYDDISCEPKTINFNNQAGDIYIEPKVLMNKI